MLKSTFLTVFERKRDYTSDGNPDMIIVRPNQSVSQTITESNKQLCNFSS